MYLEQGTVLSHFSFKLGQVCQRGSDKGLVPDIPPALRTGEGAWVGVGGERGNGEEEEADLVLAWTPSRGPWSGDCPPCASGAWSETRMRGNVCVLGGKEYN